MTKELKKMLKELGDNHKLGIKWYWRFKNQIDLSITKANLDGFKEGCETIEKAIRISDKQNER